MDYADGYVSLFEMYDDWLSIFKNDAAMFRDQRANMDRSITGEQLEQMGGMIEDVEQSVQACIEQRAALYNLISP